jgi:hypothetical protein
VEQFGFGRQIQQAAQAVLCSGHQKAAFFFPHHENVFFAYDKSSSKFFRHPKKQLFFPRVFEP